MLHKRLKQMRKNERLSQQELADKLGINRSTLAKYEQNERHPPNDVLVNIAEMFNVTTDYLLGRTDSTGARILTPEELEEILPHKLAYDPKINIEVEGRFVDINDKKTREKIYEVLKEQGLI